MVAVRPMALAAPKEVINPDRPSKGSRPQGPSETGEAPAAAFVPGTVCWTVYSECCPQGQGGQGYGSLSYLPNRARDIELGSMNIP